MSAPVGSTRAVRVFYVTDRRANSVSAVKQTYSGERSDDGALSYGSCVVTIPKSHTLGFIEQPGLFEFSEDAAKHVVLQKVVPDRTSAGFYDRLKHRVASSELKDAFIFIHGYNTSFEDAARRTAQIAYDLKFEGAAVFYSWPSQAKLSRYSVDETNIDWTIPHLIAFLREFRSRSGAERVHIIAHSMGARILTRAMEKLNGEQQITFTQIILAAPDIDRDTFRSLAAAMNWRAERVTLYASSRDRALEASKSFNGYPRAGEAGKMLVICPGIDTIDASSVNTDFLGHSYFGGRTVLSDIFVLFRYNLPPQWRFAIYRQYNGNWVFNP